MNEVWNHRVNVPGHHPAGHWICHAFLQPLLTFRSIEFYFWMLSSFYKNPIRALECPLPLHSVAQPRDKEAGLSVCNQITSLRGPQLRTGNLKFLASLQFPNPSLQSPWAFLHDLAVSALQTGLTQLTASVLSAYSVKGSERSQDVLDPERPRCPDASLSSGGALLPIFFNEARSFLTRYFVHLIYFCWCLFGGGFYFDHNLVSLREGPLTRLVGSLTLIDFSKQFPLDFHNGYNIKVICWVSLMTFLGKAWFRFLTTVNNIYQNLPAAPWSQQPSQHCLLALLN